MKWSGVCPETGSLHQLLDGDLPADEQADLSRHLDTCGPCQRKWQDLAADEQAWAERSAHRARLLVCTEGPAGGRWWGMAEGRWDAADPPGEARDSYGCGDSFAAGFTFGLAGGLSVEEAAALGARCGAVALTRAGAP